MRFAGKVGLMGRCSQVFHGQRYTVAMFGRNAIEKDILCGH